MTDIVDVLEEVAEVAHWTAGPDLEVEGSNPARPPLVTWRYKNPTEELADFFQRAIGTFLGTISWTFLATERPWNHRSWGLLPTRVKEYSDSHGNCGAFKAAADLMETDPDFGRRANAELPLLAEHIRRCLTSQEIERKVAQTVNQS